MRDKHLITEEPCELKDSRTVLKTSGFREELAEFNHNLAKSISDAGWGMFQTMLKYKAEQEGKTYLEIGRFFPSSHLCNITLLSLAKMDFCVRSFLCAHCNIHHDRDINAAINIKNEGLRILALGTSATALGSNVRPKRFGRKSTTAAAIADELGSLHRTDRSV